MYSKKWDKLCAYLENLGKAAVAFSAGVDSTLLLKAAKEVLGGKVLAITADIASSPQGELKRAESFCESIGAEHIVVRADQLSIPGFKENPPERCYICKKALFTELLKAAAERGFVHVAEGTNADDTGDYRPGMKAIRELGIHSPLKEAGLTKAEIRSLSKELGLPSWNRSSMSCLATRLPYGDEITMEKMSAIDRAEMYIRSMGIPQVRVRMHGTLARIEVVPECFEILLSHSREVAEMLESLGFKYVTMDLSGFQSGSMNKVLDLS